MYQSILFCLILNIGRLRNLKLKLPSDILAFKLIRRAKISKVDKILVLTGMNLDNMDSLYEDGKPSLKKFVEDITGMRVSQESNVKFQAVISGKIEDVLLTTDCEKFSGERTQNLGTFGHHQRFVSHSGVAKIRTRKKFNGRKW